MRLFVAAAIPQEVRDGLARAQNRLRAGLPHARWASLVTMHLTILFLGEVEEPRLDPLSSALSLSLAGPEARGCQVRVRGLGVFPDFRRPRVLWAGLEDSPPGTLSLLHDRAAGAAAGAGLATEDRPFRPHLTLARLGDGRPPASLRGQVDAARDEDLGEFEVRALHLYQSLLKPGGAEHRRLREYPLP